MGKKRRLLSSFDETNLSLIPTPQQIIEQLEQKLYMPNLLTDLYMVPDLVWLDLKFFLILQWCKSNRHSVETIFEF